MNSLIVPNIFCLCGIHRMTVNVRGDGRAHRTGPNTLILQILKETFTFWDAQVTPSLLMGLDVVSLALSPSLGQIQQSDLSLSRWRIQLSLSWSHCVVPSRRVWLAHPGPNKTCVNSAQCSLVMGLQLPCVVHKASFIWEL